MDLRRIAANTALMVAAVAVALVLAEAATRLVAPQNMSGSWFVVGPRGIMMNRASGTARDVLTPERTAYYEFNSWHQRGREEPDPTAARVLILGDSFSFGLGLALDDTYVQSLQRKFDELKGTPRIQLLNASAGGWGTADQLAYLEGFGERLNPSAVVVFVNAWDVARARDLAVYQVDAEGRSLSATYAVNPARNGLKKLLQDNPIYSFLLDHSHLVQLLRRAAVVAHSAAARAQSTERRDEAKHISDEVFFRLLMHRMAAWCAQHGVQLTVLTTGWPEIDYPWLDKVMKEEGVFFRDLGPAVAPPVKASFFDYAIKGDGHPNEEGARLIAAAAWPILEGRLSGLKSRALNEK